MGDEWYIDRTEEDPDKRERVCRKLLKKASKSVKEYNIEPGDEEEIEANIDKLTKDRAVVARKLVKLEKKMPTGRRLPFVERYRKDLVVVTVVAMATTALAAFVLGSMWMLQWLFSLGIVLVPITFIVGMMLYFSIYLTPSKFAAQQEDFEKVVLEHDGMTAEIQVWREEAVRIRGASDREVVNPTVQSLQKVIDDPHIPPDIKLEAKKRVSMSEDEP